MNLGGKVNFPHGATISDLLKRGQDECFNALIVQPSVLPRYERERIAGNHKNCKRVLKITRYIM